MSATLIRTVEPARPRGSLLAPGPRGRDGGLRERLVAFVRRYRRDVLPRRGGLPSRTDATRMPVVERRRPGDAAEALEIRDLTLGCFAHDVRSPLTASHLALSTLLATASAEGRSADRRLLEAATRGLESIEHLMDEVLDLDRLRGISTIRDGTHLDLAEIAADVAARCSAPQHVDTLLVSTPVVGMAGLLLRAVSSLVQNTFDHGGQHAELIVAPAGRGGLVLVDDDGEGVPVVDRDLVFEPFVRLDQDAGPGLGLGLALVRRIAILHGGTAWVEESPLGGARFGLWVPLALATS